MNDTTKKQNDTKTEADFKPVKHKTVWTCKSTTDGGMIGYHKTKEAAQTDCDELNEARKAGLI